MGILTGVFSFVSLLVARNLLPGSGVDVAGLFARVAPSVAYIECRATDGEEDSGSGFIVRSTRRTTEVITAAHVVACGGSIGVTFRGRRRAVARVVVLDRDRDVALVRTSAGPMPALVLAHMSQARPGRQVAIFGYPRVSLGFVGFGDKLQPTIHMGIISAVRLDGNLLQFDAASDFGDSGGPVVDLSSGAVLGIVQGGAADSEGQDLPGSGLAISSRAISEVLHPSRHPTDALLARYLGHQTAHSADEWSATDTEAAVFLILLLASVLGVLWVAAAWRIARKAGYHGAWALLMLVPIVNLVLPYVFAFAEWPAERQQTLWDALAWDDLEPGQGSFPSCERPVGPLRAWLRALERYAVFAGRTGREEFWCFLLVSLFGPMTLAALWLFVVTLAAVVTGGPAPSFAWLHAAGELYVAALLVPSLAICVRRLHDTGRSGWNLWLVAIPLLGWLLLIAMLAEPGQCGANRYGPQPPAGCRSLNPA
jgi:uncharacterized membrane protein YhaH (DUF805 family)